MHNSQDQMSGYTQMLIYIEMALKNRLRQAVQSTLNEFQVNEKKTLPFFGILITIVVNIYYTNKQISNYSHASWSNQTADNI